MTNGTRADLRELFHKGQLTKQNDWCLATTTTVLAKKGIHYS